MSSRKKSNSKVPATGSVPAGTMTKPAGSHFLPTRPNANTATPRSLPRSPISEPAGSTCLQTSPSTITAATVSHPRSPMTEPAGTTFLPTSPDSNTAATGSLPSTPIAKAAGSGFISTSPTRALGIHSSNLPRTLVGYVHNISPIKRNKRNTLDYSTFKLQLGEKLMQEALCYSPSKRAILAEKEASRIPVKITRYTKTADLTKVVVNDITQITAPNSFECSFQFSQDLSQQKLTTLDKLHEGPEDNITVKCKVLKLGPTKAVGQAKYHVLNATIADATGQIVLDVWNDIIPNLQENKVYTFTHLSVRYWNGIRKLTTTNNSLISETQDPALQNVTLQDINNPQQETTLKVPNIESIESIEKFKICCHCLKRIIQVTENIVNCDHCHHKMRTSTCATKLSVSFVVTHEDKKLYLTMRDDLLQQLLGPYNADTVDSNDIAEKLLFLDNITITYTNTNKVSSITM